jgi:hypothetical protein
MCEAWVVYFCLYENTGTCEIWVVSHNTRDDDEISFEFQSWNEQSILHGANEGRKGVTAVKTLWTQG